MWVPARLASLFEISRDTLDSLRQEISALKSERDTLRLQAQTSQNHFFWLSQRVNALEAERAQLIKKAYGIDIPVPEVIRQTQMSPLKIDASLFEDVGEETARELGLPAYGK